MIIYVAFFCLTLYQISYLKSNFRGIKTFMFGWVLTLVNTCFLFPLRGFWLSSFNFFKKLVHQWQKNKGILRIWQLFHHHLSFQEKQNLQYQMQLTLKCPRYQNHTKVSLLVIFIMERTTLCFITLCSIYDTPTFGSISLNCLPGVFFPKMAFIKQHALGSSHACFRAMISFDNKSSFCYILLLVFVFWNSSMLQMFVSCIWCLLALIFVCIILSNLYM